MAPVQSIKDGKATPESSNRFKGGFKVGPGNLPDGTHLRKGENADTKLKTTTLTNSKSKKSRKTSFKRPKSSDLTPS